MRCEHLFAKLPAPARYYLVHIPLMARPDHPPYAKKRRADKLTKRATAQAAQSYSLQYIEVTRKRQSLASSVQPKRASPRQRCYARESVEKAFIDRHNECESFNSRVVGVTLTRISP